MMRKICLVGLFLLSMAGLSQENLPDLAQFATISQKVVFTEDFNESAERWQLGKNCRIVPEGRDGTPALFMERTETNDYNSALASLPLDLIPDAFYRCTVWYRTEELPDNTNILAPCVEYRENGEYKRMRNTQSKASAEWKQTELHFRATSECNLLLRLFYHLTGKVWFDDLQIIANDQSSFYIQKPFHHHLDQSGSVLIKNADNEALLNRPQDFRLYLECEKIGLKAVYPLDSSGKVHLTLGNLADGEYQLKASLLDLREKIILLQDTFTLFRRADFTPSPGQVTLDEHGRFLVEGKPFLPVGVYVTWIRTVTDVKRVAEGGFNFIHSYTASVLNIKNENEFNGHPAKGMLGAKVGTPEWADNVRRSLDIIQQYNLKLMGFPCRPEFQHPAILAAYTADELPLSQIPKLQNARTGFARDFPYYPVVALTDKIDDVTQYARVADLVGVDPYPITNSKSRNMAKVQQFMDRLEQDEISFMFVPQAFNWGAHKNDAFSNYIYPTEEQIRSMPLLAAIYGCRCFCFYSYTTIFERTELKDPGSAEKFWPRVTAAAKLLRQLEPWLLSLEASPEAICLSQKESLVKARAFSYDNQVCVIITAQGPGESQAEIEIKGSPNLKSKFGHTQNLGNGKYLFTGVDIASDVLFETIP